MNKFELAQQMDELNQRAHNNTITDDELDGLKSGRDKYSRLKYKQLTHLVNDSIHFELIAIEFQGKYRDICARWMCRGATYDLASAKTKRVEALNNKGTK